MFNKPYLYLLFTIILINLNFSNLIAKPDIPVWDKAQEALYLKFQPTPTSYSSEIKNQEGILQFETLSDLAFTLQQLRKADWVFNQGFYQGHVNFSRQGLSRQEKKLGFRESLAFERFEAHFQHHSLRESLAMAEDQWLKIKGLPDSLDPDQHYITGQALRTLFNENGEVMVAQVIYKVLPSGWVFQVKSEDRAKLNEITNPESIDSSIKPSYNVFNAASLPIPKGHWKTHKVAKYELGGRFLRKSKVVVRDYVFYSVVYASTRFFKQENGNWQRVRANECTVLDGPYYENRCGESFYVKLTPQFPYGRKTELVVAEKFHGADQPEPEHWQYWDSNANHTDLEWWCF